ncbi:MAG: hypothetical protein V3U98_08825 [Acidobacteriota bacterium]
MAKGLLCGVYRDSSFGDCSMDGVTARFNRVILTGSGVAGVFEPMDDAPELVLVLRRIGGAEANYAIPREFFDELTEHGDPRILPEDGHVCFGGNYVATSDSRFRKATGSSRPLPVLDRAESWELYERLSR